MLIEPFFASLSKRQTMLLLTAVTFCGSDSVEALDYLPAEESDLLRHRAKGLLEIPKEKRIPLLVQEIKRVITARRKQLASSDPSRLADALKTERSAMVEVVLRALPVSLADAVRRELPQRSEIKLRRDVKPEVLSIIKWKLEDAIKRASEQVGLFRFSDVLTLQQRELLTICDRMGARALSTAFAGLIAEDIAKLFGTLPPDQKSLAMRATEVASVRKLSEGDARSVLTMYGALDDASAGMRSAGAQRLARACIAHGPDFIGRLIDRHPGELGRLLTRWARDEQKRAVKGDGGRSDIVEQMERLAQRGVIDRPMRLPPPPMPRVLSSGILAPIPVRRSMPAIPVPSGAREPAKPKPPSESAQGHKPGASRPRRDFMAERNARAAGAASARWRSQRGEASKTGSQSVSVFPGPKARILRDGKPVARESGPTIGERKPMLSPALQAIPKRRDPASSQKIPVPPPPPEDSDLGSDD